MHKGLLILAICVLSGISVLAQATSSPPPSGRRVGSIAGKGLTDVPGIRVGHFTLAKRPTGCTVVLIDGEGATAGVSQRGAAPGTRETDLLDPLNMVEKVNAIVLSGGSAFGLDAAQGVMRYLEEKGIGFKTSRRSCTDRSSRGDLRSPVRRRSKDAADRRLRVQGGERGDQWSRCRRKCRCGRGCDRRKLGGFNQDPAQRTPPMKSGVGSASITLPSGLIIGALAVVNAVGDIIDPDNGPSRRRIRNANGRSPTLANCCAVGLPFLHHARERTPHSQWSQPTPS